MIFTAEDAALASNASRSAHGRETICVSPAPGEMDGVSKSMCSAVVEGGGELSPAIVIEEADEEMDPPEVDVESLVRAACQW